MNKLPTKITFYEFLVPSILSGKKTITIRDETESHFVPGTMVEVFTHETDIKICNIKIESVESILFDEINEFHAQQEFMDLSKLKKVIRDIYPNTEKLFVISYKLMK
jgi:N4-acetylcytidine amidohydrolase